MPNPQTTAADNIFSVGSGIVITGGTGYAGGDGGVGISANNATITNSGSITGGEGSESVNGSGLGAVGISGTALSITNHRTGSITGGEGEVGSASGAGITGSSMMINNDGTIAGGDGSYSHGDNSGTSGIGGAGISGTDLTIVNTYRITGGEGNSGGTGGDAISGSALTITNSGDILGGRGGFGYGEHGGNAGAGIAGSNMVIDNIAGGSIEGGSGNSGGTGGDAISGSALTITNSGDILGGRGGYGYGELGGNAGAGIAGSNMVIDNMAGGSIEGGVGDSSNVGGDAISGSALSITNGGKVTGGVGGFGYGESAGNAGAGISGSNITINNLVGGSVTGGEGGFGGSNSVGGAGMPSAGGAAILGSDLIITNAGSVTGGEGGYAGGETSGPDGADGGAGISGHHLTIDNMVGGTIVGGAGSYGGGRNASVGTQGGNGGTGIVGDSLTITNSGSIAGGRGSSGQHGGVDGTGGAAISGSHLAIVNNSTITGGAPYRSSGEAGAAIDLTGGSNTLTLNTGSKITGDIVLADGAGDSVTTLHITSNDEANRAINGHLTVGQSASVTLTERPIEFSGNASFAEGASLTLGEGVSLKAASLAVEDNTSLNANITHWDMQDILLVETTNGITGAFSYSNALVAGMNQPDFAYVNAGERIIKYSLYWNGLDAAAHGTFTLDEGRTFDLGVALNDNTAHINPAWDGKSLTKAGEGTLILSAENAYTGSTDIREGMLKTTTTNAFANTSGVTVGEEGTLNLNGNSQIVNALDNRGTLLIDDYGVPPSSPLSVMLTGNVTNSGNIVLNNSVTSAGNTLTINGDYVGHGGSLMLGTVLGDDSSLTDKLVVTGNATGMTYVQVNNENGAGALLHEGIKIIETGSSTADAFVQRGRIVAGSYEYRVTQGTTSGGDMNNWYLTSMIDSPGSDEPSDSDDDDLPDPVDTTDPENSDRPVPDDTTVPENDDRPAPGRSPDAVNVYRPEGGSYASNLAAANTLFNIRLHDRQGGAWYIDPVTGEGHITSMWLRTTGGHNKDRMSDGQNTSSSNRVVMQLGGALIQGSTNGMDSYQLGVMAGYGKQNNDTHNRLSGYRSRGEVSGYSAGLYGTWYQNAVDKTGLYVDSWMLYNWFDNTVKGDELAEERYKSKGMTASLETGYTFHSGSFTTAGGWENNLYLRPQAQITWMGVKADDHTEKNGTRVQGLGDNNIQTRLGLRLSLTGKYGPDKGTVREFEPFIEANWIHNKEQYGVRMQDTNTSLQGSRNVGEVKMGVEGRLTRDLSIWGNVAQQMGNNGFRDTSGVLGIKYQF